MRNGAYLLACILRKRAHASAQLGDADAAGAVATFEGADDASLAQAGSDFVAPFAQFVGYQGGGAGLFETQFGMGMDVASQGGEFAFVLLASAAVQRAINAEVLANMTAIVVLSMIMTPFSVMLFDRYFKEPRAAVAVDDVEEHAGELNGNVLIIGFGRMGQVVSQMPLAYGATISILDNDPDTINVAREYGFKVYYGEATRADVLHACGVEHTDIVAVCVDDGESAVRIVENIHHINPNAKVFVRAWDRRNALALVKAEADFVVRETFYSSMKMGDEIVKALGASVQELRAIHDKVRDADKERFALEIAGKEFEGRRLLLGNIKKNS